MILSYQPLEKWECPSTTLLKQQEKLSRSFASSIHHLGHKELNQIQQS
jgi:hypothetical protein